MKTVRVTPNMLKCLRLLKAAENLGIVVHRWTVEGGAQRCGYRALRRNGLVGKKPGHEDWDEAPIVITDAGYGVLEAA